MLKHVVLGVFLVSSALAAQEGTKFVRPHPLPGGSKSAMVTGALPGDPLEGLYSDRVGDSLWVSADRYKAEFTPTDLVFVPAFGASASRDWPVRLHLASATVAGAELPLCSGEPRLTDRSVSTDRGSLTEGFALGDDGIEQSFRFDVLPLRGELRLSLAVQTELTMADGPDGLTFSGPDGAFRYGDAVAIDALGDRIDVRREVRDGVIELVVPPEFVAHATLPLIVDPLLGNPFNAHPDVKELRSTDVTWTQTDQQFLVCYERRYSQTDSDIYAVVLDSSASTVYLVLPIDLSTDSWTHGRIASLPKLHSHLVVAQAATLNVAPVRIFGRRLVSSLFSVTMDPSFEIAASGNPAGRAGDCWAPDVGGDSALGASQFTVVWERTYTATDHDIEMRAITPAGALASPTSISLDRSTAFESGPVISKSNGAEGGLTRLWAIVYQRRDVATGIGHLRASFVNGSGAAQMFGSSLSTQISSTRLLTSGGYDVSSPTEGPIQRRFLLAHTETMPGTGARGILGEVFDSQGVSFASSQVLAVNETLPLQDVDQPAVDSDGCRFAMAFRREFNSANADFDVLVRTLGLVGASVVAQDDDSSWTSSDYESDPSIVALHSGGGEGVEYLTAALHTAGTGPWNVLVQRYLGMGPGGYAIRATGCGPTTLSPSGWPVVGATVLMDVSAPSGAVGMLVGVPVSLAFPDCSCLLGANGFALSGNHFQFSVPCDPAIVGGTIAFQAFAVGAGSCIGAIGLSNTIDVTFQ